MCCVAIATTLGSCRNLSCHSKGCAGKLLLNRYPCLMRSKLKIWQDGAQITLQCTATGTFMSAEGGGGGQVVVNRLAASTWETFKVNLNSPSYFPFFYL